MADLIVTESGTVHRPRNVDWKRAAALLYGDWGTSKAYVIGLAFLAAGFSSLPIILAVCAVTGLVGINYIVICRHFPDGGGVYSAARSQGRALAVIGALLLVADLTVTAALSGWSALSYITSGAEHIAWIKLLRDHIGLTTIGMLLIMGVINYFGPKHSGTLAVALALPTAFVQPHWCNEARSGIDNGAPERRARIAQSDHASSNRSCFRNRTARMGDALAAVGARQDASPHEP